MLERPLVTYAVLAFNQERFIREAVQGALAQTYSPLDIILSDDHSPDRTWGILQEMAAAYRGPHHIILNRNPKNLGLATHVNSVMSLARGELIVAAAGDDISEPRRTERVVEAWEQSGRQAMSITSHVKQIDSQGRVIRELRACGNPQERQLLHRAGHGCWSVMGCSHAWHRKVFETFGPLQDYVVAEDRAIEFRSLALGTVVVVDDSLVQYRVHGDNLDAESLGASQAEISRRYAKAVATRYAMFRQFLADLDRMETLRLCPAEEVQPARRAIVHKLDALVLEQNYLRAPLLGQILLGMKAMGFIDPKTGLKWLLKSLRLR